MSSSANTNPSTDTCEDADMHGSSDEDKDLTEKELDESDVDEEESALHISPAPLHAGIFHTYDDHRLATAGAMLGLVVNGIQVENIATTKKTLPDFPGAWQAMLNG